jgi:hypothetical protein
LWKFSVLVWLNVFLFFFRNSFQGQSRSFNVEWFWWRGALWVGLSFKSQCNHIINIEFFFIAYHLLIFVHELVSFHSSTVSYFIFFKLSPLHFNLYFLKIVSLTFVISINCLRYICFSFKLSNLHLYFLYIVFLTSVFHLDCLPYICISFKLSSLHLYFLSIVSLTFVFPLHCLPYICICFKLSPLHLNFL